MLALGAALMLYAILLGNYVGAYAGSADTSGYINGARLLRQGVVRLEQRTIAGVPPESMPFYTFVPLGFAPSGKDQMVPTYPVGLPLLVVAVSAITGWGYAPHVTMWLHGLAGVLLLYGFARRIGLSRLLATIGAMILGLSPVYLFMTVQAMSDVPALVWCTAAVFGAWLSRNQRWWAVFAGAAVAMAVLIRPSNLLIILPVAVGLGLDWRRWLGLAIGGIPGAAFQASYNFSHYGKILTTGYGDVSASFSTDFVSPALESYGQWLPVLLTPGVILIFFSPWGFRGEFRRLFWIFAAWMVANFGFYAFYYHTHETWWYLRFVLPSFPPVVLAMLLSGRTLFSRWPALASPKVRAALVASVVLWHGLWSYHLSALSIGQSKGERAYPEAAHWAREHLPANAVFLCMQTSGALLYYTDFTFFRWDVIDQAQFAQIRQACARAGRPVYAMMFPYELNDKKILERFEPGKWSPVMAITHVSIWRLDDLSEAKAAAHD
jgi:4-amino-4-deoxy-L-arabinose transferase-like glycosyltransferase